MSDDMSLPRGPSYRVHRQRGPDAGTQRLMMIAGGLTGALVLIVLMWSSVGHRGGGGVPVVAADQRPVRVKPADPGGMKIPGLAVDGSAADGTGGDKLAPPPEAPNPAALAKQETAPVPATPPAVAPMIAPAPAAPVVPAPPVQAESARAAAPPVATVAPPPERRLSKPDPAVPAGHQMVQLAALTSEAAARQEWDRLARKLPAMFNGRHPVISKIDHGGHTLWRLRTSGFATESEAKQFCAELKAKGAGCAVAAF